MKRTRFIQFLTSLAAVATMGLSAQAWAADTYTWKGGRKASNNDRYYWDDTHSSSSYQWTKGGSNADWPTTQTTTSNAPDVILSSSGSNHDKVWAHDKAIIAGNVSVEAADYVITMYIQKDEDVKGDIEKWTRMQFESLALKASNLTVTSNTESGRVASPMLQLGKLTNTVNASLTLNTVSTVAAEATEVAAGTTLTIAGDSTSAGSLGVLTLGAGSTLAVTNTGANFTLGTSGQTSTLADGAKLSFTGGKTYTLNGTFAVTINDSQGGSGTGENGFAKESYSAQVVEGNVTNNATWTVNGHNATYNNGVVTAEGVSYETYHIYNGMVSVTGIYGEAGEHSGEVKTAALHDGTLDLNGTITTVNAEGGSIVMNGGSNTNGTVTLAADTTLSISGDSGSLTFTGGTLAKGAKLSFNGGATYTLSGLYEVQGGTSGGGRIIPTGNGFASGTLSADVVVGTGTVNASGATWKLNGMDASYDSGTISTAAGTLYDIYYVQSGTASVTGITQAAGTHASELQTVALNNGTLSLDGNLANQTVIAQNGTTIDAGTTAVTRNIKGLELASGATVTMQGGGSGSTSAAVANINIGTLGVESGNATLVVNQNTDDNYMNIDLHVTDTVVGDNAKLTVKGQSGKQDNSLGAITLGKNAQLELAGHRSSGQSRRFAMTINGGTLDEGAKIVISNDSAQGGSTQATYTVTGAFDVSAADSDYSNIQAPHTGNGFATGSVTTTVLQKSSGLSSNVSVTVNGTWTLNGANATYNTNNGSISASNVKYYQTYYMRQNTQSVSGIMAEAGKYAFKVTTVDLSGGTLTADAIISTVNATGGTLAFVGQGGVDTINVKGDISVSGDTNPAGKVYNIDAQKTITFNEDLQMQGVSFVGEGGTKVTIKNTNPTGGAAIQYSLDNSSALLTADKITMTAGATSDVNIGNQVAAATVENQSTNSLTLAGGDSTVKHVIAAKGNIVFHNMGDAITLESMTIGEGKQVGVYSGSAETTAAEATVSISDTLTAGSGSTLLANLVLESNSQLDLDGGQMYLGSQLTLGTNIGLDQATLDAIAALEIGKTHDLIYAYGEGNLSYSGVADGDWAREIFDLKTITEGDYKIVANDNVFGIEKVSNVPEPATGTLSLLALCALTARRRRKN